ncbi:MAG: hypothetical protein Q9171_002928 [Xanthocarpia ochracea]
MSSITIDFGTPSNRSFQWFDNLEGLTSEELDEIVIQCRSATAAFLTELTDRRRPWRDCALEDYCDLLQQDAKHVNKKGLTKEHKHQLQGVYTFLADLGDNQTERNEKKVVRHFLWLISRVIGWSYALLILCALGKNKVEKLDEDQRVKITKFIIQCHIKVDPPRTRGCKKRKGSDSVESATSMSSGHGSKNQNLTDYEPSYDFTPDSFYRREGDTSTLSKRHLPDYIRFNPMTTTLNSSNSITSASVQNGLQLTSLAPEAQMSFASCPTQATLSIVNRVIAPSTTRPDLRMIPVDISSNADNLQYESSFGSAGNVVSQPSRHVSNLGPQRQFPTQVKVSDTAQSISFAMKGDIDGLKYLFSQGLASPRDVSSSRGFNLVSVGLTTPSALNLFSKTAEKC